MSTPKALSLAGAALGLAITLGVADAAKPKVYRTAGPPHAPNLLVVARAVSLDVAMRAAGLAAVVRSSDVPDTAPGVPGELYTDDPNERRTQKTRVDPGSQVVPVLRAIWPEVGELGARVLAAQFSLETGSGRHCYNFNLGNHKAGPSEPHMFLRGVWEGVTRAEYERFRASEKFGALVREETAKESAAKGHGIRPGHIVIVLAPPHPAARFRANATVQEGVERFVGLHRRIASKNPPFLAALRAGNTQLAARILGSPGVRYYTANVDAYAQGMQNQRDIIDEGLGPP